MCVPALQNNPFVLPLMVEHVVSRAQGPGLRFLVDAYCGGGLFAITASKAFEVSRARQAST
jgi:23S rRNA (uracil1939-C5)-methyltransferase/tRNA (uracil-5-)-methyltransferase